MAVDDRDVKCESKIISDSVAKDDIIGDKNEETSKIYNVALLLCSVH